MVSGACLRAVSEFSTTKGNARCVNRIGASEAAPAKTTAKASRMIPDLSSTDSIVGHRAFRPPAIMTINQLIDRLRVPPGEKISLNKDYKTDWLPQGLNKEKAADLLVKGVRRLADFQEKLYAQDNHALLVIFQAMDAAGKDGAIEHVMSGVNPQGCQVFSFKAPSREELDHDYMWRCFRALPERGRIGIFNRSYYEDVLIVRVHPEILQGQRLPESLKQKNIWERRFREIRNFEEYLVNNAIHVVKIFLHVSKDEQRERFLARLEQPEKNWKFSVQDAKERGHWPEYIKAYEDAISNTSTSEAPWYVVPADHKWFSRLCVAAVIYSKLKSLNLSFPRVDDPEHLKELEEARQLLLNEPNGPAAGAAAKKRAGSRARARQK
jgi:PPK2 family polyphosphate:nucleotide phosphotransferase